jgi:hypothetical protein
MNQEHDLAAWRELARLMPGWRPTLAGLQKLDEGPNELGVAIRSIARGWSRDDARWDVLQGVLEFYKRQHAHALAEQQRKAIEGFDLDDHWAVFYRVSDVETLPDLIDPKAQRASTQGDTP